MQNTGCHGMCPEMKQAWQPLSYQLLFVKWGAVFGVSSAYS